MRAVILGLVVIVIFISICCDSNEPQSASTLTLSVEDVSCTEAWLQLKTANLNLPNRITLFVNDLKYREYLINKSDTLLYIDSLLPNKSYSFKAISFYNTEDGVKSNKVVSTTMDTTSHNFSNWQTFTWGNIGTSVLVDVAIINENDIWAVGDIMLRDSSPAGYTDYNAVHWDGNSWELKRIMFYYNCLTRDYSYSFGISSILVINPNEIWVSMDGTQIAKIVNGVQTDTICMPYEDFSIKKMWGTSSDDLYLVGYAGNIVHYDGTNWNRIESGTSLSINDIWGDYNQKTKEWEILAVASNIYSGFEKQVIKISNNSASIISNTGIEEPLNSVWFKTNKKYYLVGSGSYEKSRLTEAEWKGDPLDFTEYFENHIRANDINDVIAVGAYGEVLHFNGYNWKSYISKTYISGNLLSVDIKNNLIVFCGIEYSSAVLKTGKR